MCLGGGGGGGGLKRKLNTKIICGGGGGGGGGGEREMGVNEKRGSGGGAGGNTWGTKKERRIGGRGGRMTWRQKERVGGSLLCPQPALCTERCVPRPALLQVPTQRLGIKGQNLKVTTTLTSSSVWRSLGTDFDNSFLTYRSVYCLHTSGSLHMVT